MLIFISGGVRSGKSSFAEKLVTELNENRKIYLATSIPYDNEMKERVTKHQNSRKDLGWTTIEKSTNLDEIIPLLNKDDVVLIDCLTLWLSNEMFSDQIKIDVNNDIMKSIKNINNEVKDLVIVSNDIFSGVPSYEETTLTYIKNLGNLHVEIVKISNVAYECISGIPIKRKGD